VSKEQDVRECYFILIMVWKNVSDEIQMRNESCEVNVRCPKQSISKKGQKTESHSFRFAFIREKTSERGRRMQGTPISLLEVEKNHFPLSPF